MNLFIGAHADDIELLAGGTLSKFRNNAFCMVFSVHRNVSDYVLARKECENSFSNIFGMTNYEILDLCACDGNFQKNRNYIYDKLFELNKDINPSMVITHSPLDSNQDHVQIAQEVIRVFKHSSTILYGEFLNNDMNDQNKIIYVPLSKKDINCKIKAIESYKSQQINNRRYFKSDLILSRAKVLGSLINCDYAETFSSSRIIIRDL